MLLPTVQIVTLMNRVLVKKLCVSLKQINRTIYSVKMCDKQNILKKIFFAGIDAVQPKTIFHGEKFKIEQNNGKEIIKCSFDDLNNNVCIDITSKQCHVIGFGKAVFGMGFEINKVLGERLKSGLLSVPFGTVNKFKEIKMPAKLQVFEGAKNNLPDEDAMRAAQKIIKYVADLKERDILFVLISGGGSALLPLPSQGVSLKEKCDIIKQLTTRGVTINDLNRVRIDLSETKGGKLANYAKNAHKVISFIISDIINDPMHLIASGPTVSPLKDSVSSIDVLKNYDLWSSLAPHIQKVLLENSKQKVTIPNNILNLIIASNQSAVDAALVEAKKNGLPSFILSTQLDGTVKELSVAYADLARFICEYQCTKLTKDELKLNLLTLKSKLNFRENVVNEIISFLHENPKGAPNGFCIIAGGEPTVEITGTGVGGRNQELALRFSLNCFQDELLQSVLLLSAGTDGIDGKNDTKLESM